MVQLTGESLNLDQVWDVAHKNAKVVLSESSKKLIKKSRDYIINRLNNNEAIYGVNTGFGALSSVKISDENLADLQKI